MINKISSGKNGQAVFHFDNGVKLSCVWDWGTYSDNNMARPKDYTKPYNENWSSTTVEIYNIGDNPNGITEYLKNKYGGSPAGYVPVKDLPKILARAAKSKSGEIMSKLTDKVLVERWVLWVLWINLFTKVVIYIVGQL